MRTIPSTRSASEVRRRRARSIVTCSTLLVAVLAPTTGLAQLAGRISVESPEQAFGVGESTGFPIADATSTTADIRQTAASVPSPTGERGVDGARLIDVLSPEELTPTLRTVVLVGVLSLVPAVLVMTTCFARFAIVFGLLRQGLGAQQWLPNQIVLALGLFLTLFVMAPVWKESYITGIKPYVDGHFASAAEQRAALGSAFASAVVPVRRFMSTQIAATGNEAAIDMLLSYQQSTAGASAAPQYYEDVPLSVLLPAYLLSELKTAFVIGFQIVLPFLVIDLVIASILTGMGLVMLPPALVSLPFKLLLFVLIDGWTLTVEMLLNSLPPG